MKIGAGIITYNPDIERLKENINITLKQVDSIVIYDNNSTNINEIEKIIYSIKNLYIIKSSKNDGLAKGLNIIFNYFKEKKYDWVISLDQDSILQSNTIKEFIKHIGSNDVAVICPYVIDRRRKYMNYCYEKKIEEVSMCITSGSLTNIKIWEKVGKFDDWLFIDLIDNDFCKRLCISGYKIIRVNTILMNQEFGKISKQSKLVESFFISIGNFFQNENLKKFSYKKIVDPTRIYYTNRNVIYLNEKFKNYEGIGYKDNYNSNSYIGFFISFSIASFLRGKNKSKIIKAIFFGLIDGKKKAVQTKPI